MKSQLTLEDGDFLVKLARQAVTKYLEFGKVIQAPDKTSYKLLELRGVFVTLKFIQSRKKFLRGCIGLPYPTTPLAKAVIEAAISSSSQDPRFPPVAIQELNQIIFEVSILTPPQRVTAKKPTDYALKIKVGRDGIIIEKGYNKGLLLPQVPIEQGWDEEEFLCQASMKAGLSPDSWLLKDTKIYRFQAIIFEEDKPKGNVRLKNI